MREHFDSNFNLVIDDASHQYELTKRTFEILFPMMEPNGLCIIEDWAWAHWPEFQASDHRWAGNAPLTTDLPMR